MSAAVAFGVRQAGLDADLAAFFRDADPWGFILFREACESPDQVRRLTDDLRFAVGRDAMIWIDQEGGRVARLKPPAWPEFPPAAALGRLYDADPEAGVAATRLAHRLIAEELRRLGVDGDFAPVLDVPAPGADPIIGDRAFSLDPQIVAVLGRAALEGLAEGGVAGCVKHIPGHGRAEADSHLALPRVTAGGNELAADFLPFSLLKDAPSAMTAHIVYEALDPSRPATTSPIVIGEWIRGRIGFDGLLFSDDLDMKALSGPLAQRARDALGAGCDMVLHCTGVIADMAQVMGGVGALSGRAAERADACAAIGQRAPDAFAVAEGWRRLRSALA